MRTGLRDRAELPLRCVISASIEDAFADLRSRTPTDENAHVVLTNMLAGYSRARRRLDAHAVLRTPRRAAVLRRACAHMTDVDLDAAWRAALRGDLTTVDARVLPHVDPRKPALKRKGSPWRSSNWVTTGRSRRVVTR